MQLFFSLTLHFFSLFLFFVFFATSDRYIDKYSVSVIDIPIYVPVLSVA